MNFTKLNVGSRDFEGIYKDPTWLNIDIEPHIKSPSNFKIMDVFNMPAEWGNKFEVVHSVHVLEHINRNLRQNFIDQLYRVTALGGWCYVEVPDFREIVYRLNDAFDKSDLRAVHIWTTSIYGKQRSPGDAHHWGYTAPSLMDLFHVAGFKNYSFATGETPNLMISSHYKQEPVILVKGQKI